MVDSRCDLYVRGGQPIAPTNAAMVDGVKYERIVNEIMGEGNADNQVNVMYSNEVTLAPSGTSQWGWGGGTLDAFGVSLNATSICAMFWENIGVTPLQLEPGTVNPLNTFLGAGSVVKLPVGAFFLAMNRVSGRWVTNTTNRATLVRNTSGLISGTVRIIGLGRR